MATPLGCSPECASIDTEVLVYLVLPQGHERGASLSISDHDTIWSKPRLLDAEYSKAGDWILESEHFLKIGKGHEERAPQESRRGQN